MAETTHWTGSNKYLCDPGLAQSFHMARTLGMPLLIEGEPGTGKTDLPIHYAKDRGLDLEVYPVGSKSNVEQFVARFDHVKYLRDSQIEILNAQREEKGLTTRLSTGERNPESLADYVVKGPAAIAYSKPNSVLLIDEIDKAPREFPNDLLYALSHRKFIMPESGEVIEISEEEALALQLTILLHDIGHGPFSHALEFSLLHGVNHESLSFLFMKRLNKKYNGVLDLALKIFQDTYERKFFHQLVSSQLDMDRLDYLKRDSFFTGVSEGVIGLERIISMLNVAEDSIVIEEKGLYSIENFLNARRLMYWQVYLHKTSVSAEKMLINTILRAKDLSLSGKNIVSTPSLSEFINKEITLESFQIQPELLQSFAKLDDYDIWSGIKHWQHSDDLILSQLSVSLLSRKLFKIRLSNNPLEKKEVEKIRESISKKYGILSLIHCSRHCCQCT